jgi:hypothetical protein
MKKNLMSLAVAASVAGLAATAVNAGQFVNPEKTGEVILFPFYNADNGNATNMHLVNTTAEVKAVKIRFVEYKNSDEVLDFNLYLSPYDHFAFGVIKNPAGDGAAVITSDNSCTVPALGGPNGAFSGTTTTNADGSITRVQPFVNYQYDTDADASIQRTLTGHVEAIEMGVVANGGTTATAWASFATHGPTGVPAACAKLEQAWAAGAWAADESTNVSAPTGGLYGLAYHINVEEAASFGFEPTAIDDWAIPTTVYHSDPGDLFPSLGNGALTATVHNGDGTYSDLVFATGAQATSATLQTKSLMNDVMVNPAIGGQTDWVVSFPTKRLHVDGALAAVKKPFTDNWVGKQAVTGTETPACETVSVNQWDREEAITTPVTGFSPAPDAQVNKICNEVAVIALGAGATSAMKVETGLTNLSYPYTEGWMKISMAQSQAANTTTAVSGLPAIGFAAYKVQNGAMSYGNAAEHKTENVTS